MILRQLLVVAYLIFTIGLGIRSFVTDDRRYGWHMFPYQTRWTVEYMHVGPQDQRTLPFEPGPELVGNAKVLDGTREQVTWWGVGAVKADVMRYLRYCFKNLTPPQDTVGIMAVIRYQINRDERIGQTTLRFPTAP